MNEQTQSNAATSALVLGYLGMLLLAVKKFVWSAPHSVAGESKSRAGRPAPAEAEKPAVSQSPGGAVAPDVPAKKTGQHEEEAQHLQSLSLSTPGNAPLDQLARAAAAERNLVAADQSAMPPFDHPSLPWQHESAAVLAVLERQELLSPRLEGWSEPLPGRLPVPTYAPAIMAFGTILFAMGLATTWYVCLIGSIVFAVAAWRWVGELQGE